jgi:hypothetical protein
MATTQAHSSQTGYRQAGDIDVRAMSIISGSGQIVDVEGLVADFSIFQDIESHYMKCELVLNDSVGLMNTFIGNPDTKELGGFNGDEFLVISFKSNSDDLPYKNHVFSLYQLTDRQRAEERNEMYILSGISTEAYSTAARKINRAYGRQGGNQICNMVQSVYSEFFNNQKIQGFYNTLHKLAGVLVTKDFECDLTNGLHRYIIPSLSVDDTMDFFADESDSDDHIPLFNFFENSHGFRYKNISNLVKQEPKEKFIYAPSNNTSEVGTANVNDDRTKMRSFYVKKQTNFLENLDGGLYNTQSIHLDVLQKTKRVVDYTYEKSFDRFTTFHGLKIPGQSDSPSVVRLKTSDFGRDRDMKWQPEAPLPKTITETAALTDAYSKHIFNTVVEVVLPGDSELDVGDVVLLQIPAAAISNDQDGESDKYLSGSYLITKLRHKMLGINGDNFTTTLECVKDTGFKV